MLEAICTRDRKAVMAVADCQCLLTCPFFNDQMADMPAMSDVIKARYCTGDSAPCARFQVYQALGRPAVPRDLYPSEVERAREIIERG